jgi:hypothetical protein
MSVLIPKNTATAALRRIPFSLVDATDLVTPEDIVVTGVKVNLTFNGAAPAASTNDIVKVNGVNGEYYVELTQAESNTALGWVRGYLTPAGCALTKVEATIGPLESFDSPATSLPISAGGITAASFAANAVDAAALAADAVAEIQAGLATAAALNIVDDFLDTEISAIKAKTDNLPVAPAAVGSAMTLAVDSVNASALAADAVTEIVTGVFARAFGANYQNKTFAELMGVLVSGVAGPTAGAGTVAEIFKTPANNVTTHTVNNDGANRTSVVIA